METDNGFGICICGLNGSGKTTLGGELANKLAFYHMDVEHYYFDASDITYSSPHSHADVERRLLADMARHPRFILSAVKGRMADEICKRYRLIIYLEAPAAVRMDRIQKRSYARFGERMCEGGDLYESERDFLTFAEQRTATPIEAWLGEVKCPVLRLSGVDPVQENIGKICKYIESMKRG